MLSAARPDGVRVVAVVVTWNRRDLLEESLAALAAQTLAPAAVVVVDNASTDGTTDLLRERYAHLEVVHLTANTGGAGGFAAGIERALTYGPDLVWLLDDDTVPDADGRRGAGDRLVDVPGRASGGARQPGGLDRRPRPPDEHAPHEARRLRGRATGRGRGGLPAGPLAPRSSRSRATRPRVRERGPAGRRLLPLERRLRVLHPADPRRRRPVVPGHLVVHKTRTFGSTDVDPGERFFLEVRNKVWLFSRSRGLSPAEKAPLRRLDAAPLGPHVRPLDRPPHAGPRPAPRAGHRAAHPPPAQRGGAGRGRLRPRTRASTSPLPRGSRSRCCSPCGAVTTRGSCARRSPPASRSRPGAPTRWCSCRTARSPTSWRPRSRALVEASPVPRRPRGAGGERRPRPGPGPRRWPACDHEIVARMDADDVSLPDPVRQADPAGRGRRGHRRLAACSSSARRRDEIVGRRTPPTDPDEHPPGDALPRPVQPPDGRLPAQRRARRPAATPTWR